MDEGIPFGAHGPPAHFTGNVLDETDRTLLPFDLKQLDPEPFSEPGFEPLALQGLVLVLWVDKTDELGMVPEVPGGDFNDLYIHSYLHDRRAVLSLSIKRSRR